MSIKVLVVGATGYIGLPVALELAEAGLHTSALLRSNASKSNKREAALKKLKEANVSTFEASLDEEESLIDILKGFDTVVSTLSGPDIVSSQLKLISASKKAGSIHRFIPSEFGGDYILTGEEGTTFNPSLRQFLEAKETVHHALLEAELPYTIIKSYAFMGYLLPQLGQLGPPPVPETITLYAGGIAKAYTTLEADIGKVVAKTLLDPRTLNRQVVIKVNGTTQREIIATWEEISGRKVLLNDISAEDFRHVDKESKGMAAVFTGLVKSIWIDGLYDREVKDGMLATDLYPDIQFTTIREYLSQFV